MNDMQKLEEIKACNVFDLIGGKRLIWLMKRIILNQEKRIAELEFDLAEREGLVEKDDELIRLT